MRQILSIETAEALKAATAALDEGVRRGHALAVCVVDATGTPLVLLRDDHARQTTVEMAINKAWTAAAHRRATHELATVVQPGQPGFGANIQFGGRLSPLPGGLPIAAEGGVAGGIGVSGGDAETDITAARAGLNAIG